MFLINRLPCVSAKLLGTFVLVGTLASCSSVGGNGALSDIIKFSEKSMGVVASPRRVGKTAAHVPKGGGRRQVGKPYKVNGKWFYPKDDPNYNKVGKASWYGDAFHGRLTANGEIFDMNALTAAHTTLPLPSYVEVSNLENGRSLVVRVNDRGPFLHSRVIDLSRRAADLLGFRSKGVAKVRVKYIGPADLAGSDDRKLLASLKVNGKTASSREFEVASLKVPNARRTSKALKAATPKLRPVAGGSTTQAKKLTLKGALKDYGRRRDSLVTNSISAASGGDVVLLPQAPDGSQGKFATKSTLLALAGGAPSPAATLTPAAPKAAKAALTKLPKARRLAVAVRALPAKRKPAASVVTNARALEPNTAAENAVSLQRKHGIKFATFNNRGSAERLLATLPEGFGATVQKTKSAGRSNFVVTSHDFPSKDSAKAAISYVRLLGITSAVIVPR